MKSIPPRVRQITERKKSEKNTIKPIDYTLPPVYRNQDKLTEHYSMTI